MHIPDGFLSPEVAAVCAVPAVAAVGYGLRRAGRDLDDERLPLLGMTAAFVFAAQMLNFPVAGGTSGHFMGAALAALLLGPWMACVVLAVVLVLQCFIFADGGASALGANMLNMGVIGALVTGGLMLGTRRALPRRRPVLMAIVGGGAWLAVMAGAAATAIELAVSGTVPLGTALTSMLTVHALIGIGEAVITVSAVSSLLAVRPDLLALGDLDPRERVASARRAGRRRIPARAVVALGAAVAIGLATAASPWASASPDGLDRVAEDKGFADREQGRSAPIEGYAAPGISGERLAKGLAGFAGTLLTFGAAFAVARVSVGARPRRPGREAAR